jgi:hypothetical protein
LAEDSVDSLGASGALWEYHRRDQAGRGEEEVRIISEPLYRVVEAVDEDSLRENRLVATVDNERGLLRHVVVLEGVEEGLDR